MIHAHSNQHSMAQITGSYIEKARLACELLCTISACSLPDDTSRARAARARGRGANALAEHLERRRMIHAHSTQDEVVIYCDCDPCDVHALGGMLERSTPRGEVVMWIGRQKVRVVTNNQGAMGDGTLAPVCEL